MSFKHQPTIEFWYKHYCPECKSTNWTYHSHSQRSEPVYAPDACKCWNCHTQYWLCSEQDVKDMFMTDENAIVEIGLKEPN